MGEAVSLVSVQSFKGLIQMEHVNNVQNTREHKIKVRNAVQTVALIDRYCSQMELAKIVLILQKFHWIKGNAKLMNVQIDKS